MAQKFRKVDPRFWDDEKVTAMSNVEQLITLYLITSPQSNRIGFHKFSIAAGAESLRMNPETFREHFANVIGALGWRYDDRARVLYLPTWWKYNRPENPNVLRGNLDDLHDLPQSDLLHEFTSNIRYLEGTLGQTFRETLAKRYSLAGTMFAETLPQTGTGTGTRAAAETETGNTAPPPLFAATAAEASTDETILEYETAAGARSKSRTWALTRSKVDEWRGTFPGIDVEQEARNAWQWMRDNPAKRATAQGMTDFLRRWFSRAQDQQAKRAAARTPDNGGHSRSDARRERLEKAVRQ